MSRIENLRYLYFAASLLTTVQSVSKCANGEISENGACQEDKVLKRSIAEARNDVDLPKVIMGLLSPATISNHFTDIVLFQSIIAIGWFTASMFIFFMIFVC